MVGLPASIQVTSATKNYQEKMPLLTSHSLKKKLGILAQLRILFSKDSLANKQGKKKKKTQTPNPFLIPILNIFSEYIKSSQVATSFSISTANMSNEIKK